MLSGPCFKAPGTTFKDEIPKSASPVREGSVVLLSFLAEKLVNS